MLERDDCLPVKHFQCSFSLISSSHLLHHYTGILVPHIFPLHNIANGENAAVSMPPCLLVVKEHSGF